MGQLDASQRLELLAGAGPTTEQLVTSVRTGDMVLGDCDLPGVGSLEFEATAVRSERTGIHARVTIKQAEAALAFSVFNVEKDEDRTRLSNSAAKRVGGPKERASAIKLRLDQFCFGLWDAWMQSDTSDWFNGRDPGPLRRVLDPYVLADGGTIVFAKKGRGKSWLGVFWTMSVQHGISQPWWKVPEAVPALFVNLERGESSVSRRIASAGKVLGCEGMRAFHARGRSLSDVWEAVAQEIKRHGIGFVLVDSLSRSGTGNLNANDDTNKAMDLLNGLGCAYVVLGHTARGDDSHLFGSVMQENAADVVVQLQGTTSSTRPLSIGCRVEVTDANDIAKPPVVTWALDFDGDNLCGLRHPDPGEFPDFVSVLPPGDLISNFLSEEGTSSVSAICEGTELSRSTVYEALKAGRFVRLAGGRGKGSSTYALASYQQE